MNTFTPPPEDRLQRAASLQAALDLIDQGFTLIDERLRLVAWNETFLRLLDFPPEMGYVGAPFESFMRYNAERGDYGSGDPEAYVRERMDRARAFEAHDIVRTRPNGTVLRIRGFPVPGHGFVTLYSDITEQAHAEQLIREQNQQLESRVAERTAALSASNEQLRTALTLNERFAASLQRSEAQMRLITDSIPALVAYFDRDRNYRYINRGYREWFGLDTSCPECVSARAYLGDATYEQIRPNVARALAGDAVTFAYEVRTHDQRRLHARTTLIPEVTESGEVAGCFELTFDITEERRAHELLVQAQKMDALGQMTGGLAHDFNNILTVVLGNLGALAEEPAAQPWLDEFLHPAMDAARRGTELIQGLLSFSRKQPLEARAVDLTPLLRSVDKLVRHALPESMTLRLRVDEPLPSARLDPTQLQNSLINLILNARDASAGRGQVRIHCGTEQLDEMRARRLDLAPGPYVELRVEDDGCGMDATTRARIFEPFFTTKHPGEGTGLGMAMVYGFVRQSGGAIDIQSEPGRGTCVGIWLPAVGAAPAQTDRAAPPDTARQGKRGLALLVEDDASVRRIVRRLLVDLGYQVLEASSGAEAVGLLENTRGIHLLLSDIVMPGEPDGRALAQRVLHDGQVPRVVLMTGYAPETDAVPAVPTLTKPFTRAQLLAVLGDTAA